MAPISNTISELCWPADQLGAALEALAQRSGLRQQPAPIIEPPPTEPDALSAWMNFSAAQLGIEAEAVTSTYREVEQMLAHVAPALIRLPSGTDAPPLILALLRTGRRLSVLTPDLRAVHVSTALIAAAMRAPLTLGLNERGDALLTQIGIADARRQMIRDAMLMELLGGIMVQAGWLLRLPPSAPLLRQARQNGVIQPIAVIVLMQGVMQLVTLAGWFVISVQVLNGTVSGALLMAWGLLLFTVLPLQLSAAVQMGNFSTRLGGLLKQRLIFGTLRLPPDAIRHEGIGQFFSRVLDSEVVEAVTINAAFMMLLAVFQVISAAAIFAATGQLALMGLLLLWLLLVVIGSGWEMLISRAWYETYQRITNYLVEVMVGHRTRLAQQPAEQWHTQEDRLLEQYWIDSRAVDQSNSMQAALSASWLIVALAGLGLTASIGEMTLPTLLACLGAITLAQQALQMIQSGLGSTSGALQAWHRVKPVVQAATRVETPGNVLQIRTPLTEDATRPLLVARNLSYRYPDRSRWVIRSANLTLYSGDRVLIEGPSGGGKTTLAALIAGLRIPSSGLLLLRGADQASLGAAGWRQHIVIAPQFHENHIFTETFAFNLLMGRRYPPTTQDLHEAAALCAELGLSELLARMPSGLQQMVGESGWQLSHGERSRVFIARALLQGADVIILDESFGALDATTLKLALECTIRRARTLLVIAHP